MTKSKDKPNLRNHMESAVIGVNKYLKDAVNNMMEDQLLANMHPNDAEYFKKCLGRLV